MTKKIYLFALTAIILQACSSSSNVTSNFALQKRKYTQGWHFKKNSYRAGLLKDATILNTENIESTTNSDKPLQKESETVMIRKTEPKDDFHFEELPKEFKQEEQNTHETNSELGATNDKNSSSSHEKDAFLQDELEQISAEKEQLSSTSSAALYKFNLYHRIIFWMFIVSLLSIVLAIFYGSSFFIPFLILSIPMYVLIIKQRFRNSLNVPKEEQDEKFRRKRAFSATLFVVGTILAIILLLSGIITFVGIV